MAADGPRANREGEAERASQVREIATAVDWPCELKTLFRDENLGCKIAVSSGIDWFFENEEQGIILEDDCLPDPTFFQFCEEMLSRYANDQRISMISGDNFLFNKIAISDSYYFSRYSHIWGWATWRRAWSNYDVKIKAWPDIKKSDFLTSMFPDYSERTYWNDSFDGVHDGRINTWDYQWVFSCMLQNQLSIMPSINLISNIGFGSDATHTFGENEFSNMQTVSISFPLQHPEIFLRNFAADNMTSSEQFRKSVNARMRNKIKLFIKLLLRY